MTPQELSLSELWWSGPSWLSLCPRQWPTTHQDIDSTAVLEKCTHQARPFQNIGIDYWGPVIVKNAINGTKGLKFGPVPTKKFEVNGCSNAEWASS
ncbi:unnamed protein product [Toxocara canis]|uniref:Exopolygalacturonase-like n=1 Tax=Toxocara canis TaxID=6265 RepID=A0A183VB12_TOXCA|nr:unnamed protein product [Toxocara canis]